MLNSEFVHCMRTAFNPFMLNVISQCYQLKQSISVLRDVRWYFSFFFQILMENYASKQWRPRSDTVLDCTICLCPRKRTLRIYGLVMQLFCLSHKSCRNLGKYIVEIIFLVKVH